MKYRIEFDDNGIWRECFVKDYYDAITLVNVIQSKYGRVLLIDQSNEQVLTSYCV